MENNKLKTYAFEYETVNESQTGIFTVQANSEEDAIYFAKLMNPSAKCIPVPLILP